MLVSMLTALIIIVLAACQQSSEAQTTADADAGVQSSVPANNGKVQRLARALPKASLVYGDYVAAKQALQNQRQSRQQAELWQQIATELIPHWIGTAWDFNGTTQIPQQGEIACGYFVTTVLRDAGIKLNRVKLAQAASETMIRKLTTKQHIRHFLQMEHTEFISKMKAWGPGFYVVGLDNHTGFLWHDGKELYFLHASFWPEERVMQEVSLYSPVLAAMSYRVVGKLSDDQALFKRWQQHR